MAEGEKSNTATILGGVAAIIASTLTETDPFVLIGTDPASAQ